MPLADEQISLLPTETDVSFYEEHGWWISPPFLTAEELEDARFGAERYYAGERDARLLIEMGTDWTEARGNILRQNDYVSLQIEELRTLVQHPFIGAAAARLARTPEVRLFHDQLIYKPERADPSRTIVGWHTDISYWQTCSSRALLTAWIPFQDVDEEMGPMVVLDGSHRWSGNDTLRFFHEAELDRIAERIQRGDSEVRPVPMTMRAGQASFHHCRTIHGSYANSSHRPRLALAIHMQDRDNRFSRNYDKEGKPSSHINDFLCRKTPQGEPDYSDPEIFPVLWSGDV
jgi:ectoine hydroxylase-related dioxygenase (phytanoyl-CoA dioxygenase family)